MNTSSKNLYQSAAVVAMIRIVLLPLAAVLITSASVTPAFAATFWFTGGADGGDWANKTNWSYDASGTSPVENLPEPEDSVQIDRASAKISSDTTVDGVLITLLDGSTLAIESGGALVGGSVSAVYGSKVKILSGATVENAPATHLYSGSTLTIESGGTFVGGSVSIGMDSGTTIRSGATFNPSFILRSNVDDYVNSDHGFLTLEAGVVVTVREYIQ
ncbi:MAG: hypothetical protein LBK99_22505, partial [Opitutaceae bacterium]|nr:hypothetical protein [Opitutaceae bacterium]